MFSFKFFVLIFLVPSLLTVGASSDCHSKNGDLEATKNLLSTMDDGDLKVVAEGSDSPIKTTFAAVIRDAETYAAIRALAGNLPALNEDFFRSHLIISAFLGERNTGGYGVTISREQNGQIRVAEKVPRKDMMATQ